MFDSLACFSLLERNLEILFDCRTIFLCGSIWEIIQRKLWLNCRMSHLSFGFVKSPHSINSSSHACLFIFQFPYTLLLMSHHSGRFSIRYINLSKSRLTDLQVPLETVATCVSTALKSQEYCEPSPYEWSPSR